MLPFKKAFSLQLPTVKFLTLLTLLTINFSLTATSASAQFVADGAAGVTQFQDTIARLISIASGLAIMAITVMFVYAGIKFITSSGDQKNIQAAQQTATWAVLGAVFLVMSWIVLLIIQTFTGVNVTTLCFNFGQCS